MQNNETSVLAAVWRFRWLVVVVTALVVAVGFIYYLVRPQEAVFLAQSTVVLQEPTTSAESSASQNSTQFIRSQLEIFRSPVVADEAASLLAGDGHDVSAEQVGASVTIVGSSDSPLVSVIAEFSDAELAVAASNAMADAYRRVTQRQATATSDAQVARIDAQVDAINERLDEIDAELEGLVADDDALQALADQADRAVDEIARLQEELLSASAEDAPEIRDRIGDFRSAITVYNDVLSSSSGGPEQRALVEEQTGQIDRRARLLILRDEIAVDAGLAPDAVALVQQATDAQQMAEVGLSRILAVALIVGGAIGAGLAYFLSVSRRTLTRRSEPETVLGAPLLADVPEFELEGIESPVPVRDYPRSAAAEAFRFAAASAEGAARSHGMDSLFVVSSTLGQGKSTTAVNMAIASSIHGRSVVVVDCDFGNQQSSRLLLGEIHPGMQGATDVIEGVADLSEAVSRVELGNGVGLHLLSRGTRPSLAAAALQSEAARQMFEDLKQTYDLVLIDGPPLLQVAYSSTLARLADGLVVVVEHEGSFSELTDLKDRLDLVERPIVGYVYNRSPLRREMTMTEGSMMDILGDAGFVDSTSGSRRKRPD